MLKLEHLHKYQRGDPSVRGNVMWVLSLGDPKRLFMTPITTRQLADASYLQRTLRRRGYDITLPRGIRYTNLIQGLLDVAPVESVIEFPFKRGTRVLEIVNTWTTRWMAATRRIEG